MSKDSNNIDDLTHEAMCDPKVGDRFQEMYHFWVYVIKTTKKHVWTISAASPCVFPKDGCILQFPREMFKKHYSYNLPDRPNKYWIRLVDRGNDVTNWIKRGKK